ncbi:hypothetical protein [Nostoc sp.]|uniref:hypothetical protein n=1 Tax=Nostoc sp. TaxID=1180 RepID=UPI002FFC6F61
MSSDIACGVTNVYYNQPLLADMGWMNISVQVRGGEKNAPLGMDTGYWKIVPKFGRSQSFLDNF